MSQLEKVKNFLIYQTDRISVDEMAKKGMIEYINFSWKHILENLSSAEREKSEDENQFLRQNYIINFYSELATHKDEDGKIVGILTQLSDIHSLIKYKFKQPEFVNDKINCYHKMKKYIQSLRDMSYKFRDLANPNDSNAFKEFDEELISDFKMIARQLSRLDIQTNALLLLLAIYEKYMNKPIQLLDLMKLCEIFMFRIYYIGNWRSYSAQSTIYSLANRIYKGELNYNELLDEIKKMINQYCPKDRIRNLLSDTSKNWYDWGGLKYILYEYERKRCEEETGKTPKFEWEDLRERKKEDSIEHILPRTIIESSGKEVEYWITKFDDKSYEKNINRLGNLTLSTSKENSKLGNASFDKKKEIYKSSNWQIAQDIANDYEEWTEEYINEREQKLLDFAVERWGIDIIEANDYEH